MSEAAPERPARYQRSFGGMIGALLVLLVGLGTFVVLRDANRLDPAPPVQAVDYVRPARFAQEEAGFDVLAPRELPEGWSATSVRFDDGDGDEQAWHLGLLTAEQRYIGVEQAERTAAAMVEDFVDADARQGGEVEVGGETWTAWSDPGRDPGADPSTEPEGDLALVREDEGVTALVVGTVSQDALSDFVATLS